MSAIAILAYGSLIDNPGPELSRYIVGRRSVETPFHVEYARASRRRGGAPTLIPVTDGGSKVPAVLLVLAPSVSDSEAKDMLWRRETDLKGHYAPPPNPTRNHVLIDVHPNLGGIPVVFSTRIGPNIEPLTA
jgi:cation transport regulator ChaC